MSGGARPHVTVGDWVRLSAQKHPDRAAFVLADGHRLTFAEVNSRVNRLANALAARGVGKGDRLAILDTDSHRYLETVMAALKLGAVYVPLNYRLVEPEVVTLCDKAEPVAFFAGSRYRATAEAVAAKVPSVRHLVGYGDGSYEELLKGAPADEPPRVSTDEDIVGLAFTSGTTGLPKGVLQSQGMVKHMVLSVAVDTSARPGEYRYTSSPMFHITGMCMGMLGIGIGFTSLILPQFDPSVVLRYMRAGELTAVFLVPTMISTLLQQPDVEGGDYGNLRLVMYGAAPMTPALLKRAMATFDCDFLNLFGAGTEAGLQTSLPPEDHRRALAGAEHLLGSIGKPSFGVELRLCDEQLRDVPRGEVGEIVTRSDTVMSGYLDLPEATAHALVDGWFRAGDLARMDGEGYLYLAGRSKDMIIRGGENIYPLEVETVLAGWPGVGQVAVIGLPDPHWGEVVHAILEVPSGQAPSDDELRAFCRQRLAAYKVPNSFEVVRELPRNASGKILKTQLRAERGVPA